MLEPVTLDTEEADRDQYLKFIVDIRTRVGTAITRIEGQEFHATDASRTGVEHYLPIRLHAGEVFVEVYMRSSDLYIVGYRNMTAEWQAYPQSVYHHFSGTPSLPGASDELLPFDENYNTLESDNHAGITRGELNLGHQQLVNAVHGIFKNSDPVRARGILILAQMIAEAARFFEIARHVHQNWDAGRILPSELIDIQTNWSNLSGNIGGPTTSSNQHTIHWYATQIAILLGAAVVSRKPRAADDSGQDGGGDPASEAGAPADDGGQD